MGWLLKTEPPGYSFEDLEGEMSTARDSCHSVVPLSPPHVVRLAGD